jgi:hypothetical protein
MTTNQEFDRVIDAVRCVLDTCGDSNLVRGVDSDPASKTLRALAAAMFIAWPALCSSPRSHGGYIKLGARRDPRLPNGRSTLRLRTQVDMVDHVRGGHVDYFGDGFGPRPDDYMNAERFARISRRLFALMCNLAMESLARCKQDAQQDAALGVVKWKRRVATIHDLRKDLKVRLQDLGDLQVVAEIHDN